MLLHIMSQYLWLFSLILQGLPWRGGMPTAGILAGKGANIGNLFCTAPKFPQLHESHFWIFFKNYWAKKVPEGAHTLARRVGGAPPPLLGAPLSPGPPGGPPVPIFCYMKSFTLEKIRSKLTGRNSAATRRNLGGINLGLWRSYSARDTSLREGEIITNVITNDPLIGRGSISINIFTSTISYQTLVHLLYPIFVSKPQIGTCGLLVVLITPCSWC